LEKARTCAFQANYHLIWATKYRRKVLVGSVEVRLVEVLKTIANQSGFQLLAARVHGGDHVPVGMEGLVIAVRTVKEKAVLC